VGVAVGRLDLEDALTDLQPPRSKTRIFSFSFFSSP